MNDAAIGVFDSGMGGLTVMRALKARLPQERFVYLGDTARLPYGTKSANTVRRYALQAATALTRRGVKLVVIACNTASVSLPALKDALAPLPVVGVIEPGAEAALAAAQGAPIAVIATEGTVKGGAYVRAIEAKGGADVAQQACPLFVPLSEEGLTEGPIAEAIAHRYLDPLLATMPKPRCLLLGCTHYPALKDVIARVAGPEIALVDSAETTAEAVARLLKDEGLQAPPRASALPEFLVTDAPDRFARVGEIFLGEPIDPGTVELVDLQ
ncbi:MAG: glutamate racemase [Alphaproteobacteria bacterium]|nr:glutamate racemase [Alphaproteobacteria bacterium]MBU6471922.1 glutamate racemase [Alphaproteobacteria bacterium]MDE2013320.1 glutamate racemase [Alphaproteobacteria bacterium]MDE2072256.1 glutamate racemase [Alphaproteobacteria bacterium]MDE2350651.1 glutamate racemase [Alphaproteobacteria bacterium]